MFILRSLFISISLFGVNDCCPLGGVTSNDTPVLCMAHELGQHYAECACLHHQYVYSMDM